LISLLLAWGIAEYLARNTGLGVAGLSLAFSIGSTVNALSLFIALKLPLREIIFDGNGRQNFLYLLVGTLITTTVFILAKEISPEVSSLLVSGESVRRFVEIIFGLLIGIIFYIAWGKATKLEQWQLIQPEKTSTKI
jgi:hypothetical protein